MINPMQNTLATRSTIEVAHFEKNKRFCLTGRSLTRYCWNPFFVFSLFLVLYQAMGGDFVVLRSNAFPPK